MEKIKLSIVVPVYNEADSLAEFSQRLFKIINLLQDTTCEVIFVNDGSNDNSARILSEVRNSHGQANMRVITFSRNFGHQAAIFAGMKSSHGECVVTIDADLQDPPELIESMLEEYRNGFDIVFAQREKRLGEKIFKKFTAQVFYRVLTYLSETDIPVNTGDFRLVSRRALDALLNLNEAQPYVRGLVHWIGFKQTAIKYVRDARFSGETHYSWTAMIALALSGVIGFSNKPLKLGLKLCQIFFSIAILYSFYNIAVKVFFPETSIPGYASLITVILWAFSIQMLILAIIGVYIQFLVEQSRGRPRYIIMEEN